MNKILIFSLVSLSTFLVSSAFFRPFTVNDILTQSPWTTFECWKDLTGTGVFVNTTYECQNDNHWSFVALNQVQITEGPTECEPEMPEMSNIEGNWQLLNQERSLQIRFLQEDPIDFQIIQIGQHQVTLNVVEAGFPVRERIILKR